MALTGDCYSFLSYLNGKFSSIIINHIDRSYLSFCLHLFCNEIF